MFHYVSPYWQSHTMQSMFPCIPQYPFYEDYNRLGYGNDSCTFSGNVMSLDSSKAMRDRLTSSGSVLSDESDFFDIDDNAFEEIDPRLRQAASRAAQEKQITPLIKEELRLSILSRRNKEGKGDVVFEEKQAPAKRSLTPQEKERKLRRQEQNRRAARRCRKKKKDTEVNIMKAYYAEKDKNHSLNSQIEELRKEKEKLDEILKAHLPNCPLTTNQTTTVSQPFHTDNTFTKSLISTDTSFQYSQNRFDNGPLNSTEDEMDTSFLPADFDESLINQDPFDECCSNIDIPWRRQQPDIQGGLEPLNLDSCYGSEQENTDIRNIIESCTGDNYSTDNIQFCQPQATQSSVPQSECNQQPILTDSRITMDTSVEDTLPETTLSGLEGIVSLLYAQSQNDSGFISYDGQRADVDIEGSLSNLANISDCHSNVAQSWETTSYTELNDIVHNDLCQP